MDSSPPCQYQRKRKILNWEKRQFIVSYISWSSRAITTYSYTEEVIPHSCHAKYLYCTLLSVAGSPRDMSSAVSGSGSDEQVRVGGAVESPLAASGEYRVLCLVGGAGRHTSAARGRGGHRRRERETRCNSEHALVMVVTQYT